MNLLTSSVPLSSPNPSKLIALGGDSALCASRSQSAEVITRPREVGSRGAAKDIRALYSSVLVFVEEGECEEEEGGGMLPSALRTARVAHALLTVWWAKKPGK